MDFDELMDSVLEEIDSEMTQGNCLVQITTSDATFGLIAKGGIVVQAAPISSESVGRPVMEVIRFYRQQGEMKVQIYRLGDDT
jgi:hypothetical protein